MNRFNIPFVLFVISMACSSPPELKTGRWRAVLLIQNTELPFGLQLEKTESGYQARILNAEEEILLDEVTVKGDSITLNLHVFDAALRARIEGDRLTGAFVRYYAPGGDIPFEATFGQTHRFAETGATQPPVQFTGKYQILFSPSTGEPYPAVGIFEQEGNRITGTFLTPTGDYRYLAGNLIGEEMHLSAFDGNHAFLFTARLKGDSIMGEFRSGKSGFEKWQGTKNDKAALPDAETLTFLKPGYQRLEFAFPNLGGDTVRLSDERFREKVVILQILGTWCPNCMDETKFLAAWYDRNKDRGVEILGLAYERKADFNYARDRVHKMKEKWHVKYDFVVAGTNDKKAASETLPALNRVVAFPTTIFIGKDGHVKHIHTGFNGPGTGIYYEQFQERFNQIVNELLREPVNP